MFLQKNIKEKIKIKSFFSSKKFTKTYFEVEYKSNFVRISAEFRKDFRRKKERKNGDKKGDYCHIVKNVTIKFNIAIRNCT